LQALGLPRADVRGSLRFSLSAHTTLAEIDYVLPVLKQIVTRLREIAPSEEADLPQHAHPLQQS
jgi:cysteine desulfurase